MFLDKLFVEEVGFRTDDDGAWLWRFTLEPLRSEVDTPRGSAVHLTSLLGIPFARLRAALPDELLSWDMGAAMGRRYIFSRKGLNEAAPELTAMLPALVQWLRTCKQRCGKAAVVENCKEEEPEDEPQEIGTADEDVLLEEFVGARFDARCRAAPALCAVFLCLTCVAWRGRCRRHRHRACLPAGCGTCACVGAGDPHLRRQASLQRRAGAAVVAAARVLLCPRSRVLPAP
jgi:hypothetical protein